MIVEPIRTHRLVLRPFQETDREQTIRLLRNEEISRTFMLSDFPDDDAAGKLFERILKNSLSDAHFEIAICLEDQVIGFLNDVEITDGTIELGYVIHPDHWGRGYATESLTAVIWALFHMGFHRVCAGYFEDNLASGRVMEKSGMHRIDKTEEIEYRGKTHQCLYYEIENPIRKLGEHIRYLPASRDPLSAEVYCIRGRKGVYLYDVGNNEQSLAFIRSIPNVMSAVLSHHHKDHTGNLPKTGIKNIYVGDFTRKEWNSGTAVTQERELEEGISIIPCPSVHTQGSLLLNVFREYCLIGDLFFCRKPVPMDQARKMLEALARVDTQYFVFSHSGREGIYEKKIFLSELKREFEKEEDQ